MVGILSALILIVAFFGATVSVDRIRAIYEREGLHFLERWRNWERRRDPLTWQSMAELFTWELVLWVCLFVIAIWAVRHL